MPRRILPALAVSLAALAYAVAVVVVAWRMPDKGFLAFTGHRVVHVTAGGDAARAGVRPGDVVSAIDGRPVTSTLDYVDRLLRRRAGEEVALEFRRPGGGAPVALRLVLPPGRAPLASLGAAALALVLLGLGLVALVGRPGEAAARRFWQSTVIYALVYAGALSWNSLLVHPVLLVVFLGVLFVAAHGATDFMLAFPAPPRRSVRGWRLLAWSLAAITAAGTIAALSVGLSDWRAGRATDRALPWTARLVAVQLGVAVLGLSTGLLAQWRAHRELSGAERAQLKWLLFGFALCLVPALAAVPVAVIDLDRFLLLRYRPFVSALALLWFAAATLAVLRVRLADVDAVIHRSMVYTLATGASAGVYLAVVLGVGVVAQGLLGDARLLPHLLAAVSAAALFGPLSRRVGRWLDRRFFRDRLHYVQALRGLAEMVTRLAEPRDLAEEVVARTVGAVRASGGALYLAPDGGGDGAEPELELARARGDGFPDRLPVAEALAAPEGGVAVPIRGAAEGRTAGVLVLRARLGGDLYSREDRDLLGALAGQLAVAIDNARAFGTIKTMSRTLAAQNREIQDLRDKLEDENRYLKGRLDAARGEGAAIVGSSKPIVALRRQLERIAPTPTVVLLLGESGTGKGLVAEALHAASDRAAGPLIHVDCGAIPPGVFESELFGHERGAFTGAVRNRRGHFELAHGGTLFLDEIGELPPALQPKLLRVLQERSFLRVGGSKEVSVDVRIVAATNRNLADMVVRGEFREDLYYRLKVVELTVPPLRERRGDIPELCDYLLPRICRQNHRPPRTLAAEARERLLAYGWPGNVRELENVLERAAVLCEGREIKEEDLALPDKLPPPAELEQPARLGADADHREIMEAVEKRRLVAALRAAGGNQSHAARALGIARTTLINKLRRYGLL